MGTYTVQYADGTTKEIPDSEPIFTGDQVRSAWQFSPDDTVGSAAKKWGQQLGQGATIGFGDELAAIPATLMQALAHPFFGTEIKNPVQNWREMNADVDQSRAESPGKALLANMAGGLPSALATGPSAGSQALYGAASGFGGGDTLNERMGGGLVGALAAPVASGIGRGAGIIADKTGLDKAIYRTGEVGAELGGAMVKDLKGMFSGSIESQRGAIGRGFGSPIRGATEAPLTAAERMTAQSLLAHGVGPDDIAQAIASQRSAIADGQGVQTLGEAMGKKTYNWQTAMGADVPTGGQVHEALTSRQEGIYGRLQDALDVITPERSAYRNATNAIENANILDDVASKKLAEASKPFYEGVAWNSVPGDAAQEMLTAPVSKQVAGAVFSGRPGGAPSMEGFARGAYSPGGSSGAYNLEDAFAVKSGLLKLGRSRTTGTEQLFGDQADIMGAKLSAALHAEHPELAVADAAYPNLIKEAYGSMDDNMRDFVTDVARSTPDSLPGLGQKLINGYPEVAQALAKGSRDIMPNGDQWMRDAARAAIGKRIGGKENLGLAKGMLGRGEEGARSTLPQIIGQQAADKLERVEGREIAMQGLANRVLANSPTAPIQAELEAQKRFMAHAIDWLQNPKQIPSRMFKAMFTNEMVDANLRREVAQILFSQGEDAITKAQRLMPYVQKLQKIDNLAKQITAGAGGFGTGGITTGIRGLEQGR